MEGEVITMQEIFTYERTGMDKDGRVLGRFRATGIRPKFMGRLRTFGIDVREQMFDPARVFD